MSRIGIIVDGYSTGAGLVKGFERHGIQCIHIQSQPTIPQVYLHTFEPNNYYKNFVYPGDLVTFSKKLEYYQPEFIIPGAECGIELADKLSEALGLSTTNGSQLSECRRNKYLMWQQAKEAGLQVIPSFKAYTLYDLLKWASQQQNWPLVVKPLTSAGGEGVKVCNSFVDCEQAYQEIVTNKTNMLGFNNEAVLIQHYISGDEYVVNTVSHAGNHKLCELWSYSRYERPHGKQIYNTAKAINYDEGEHKEIVQYAITSIEALGINYGPAHVEIIKNKNGCYLIELGARLMGANLNPMALLGKRLTIC